MIDLPLTSLRPLLQTEGASICCLVLGTPEAKLALVILL